MSKELEAKVAQLEIVAALTGEQKTAFDSLTEAERDDFLSKDEGERTAAMKALTDAAKAKMEEEDKKKKKPMGAKDGDEAEKADPVLLVLPTGEEVRKSDGALTLKLARESVERETADNVEKYLGNTPGDLESKKSIVKAVMGIRDEAERTKAFETLKANDDEYGKSLGRQSSGAENKSATETKTVLSAVDAHREVAEKVRELRKSDPDLDAMKAMETVITEDAERYAVLRPYN